MNFRILSLLEFDKVKEKISKYLNTNNSKEILRKLEPFSTIEEVHRNLEETFEALNFIKNSKSPEFYGLDDILVSIEKIEKSGVVTVKEIYKVGTTLKCMREIKTYLSQGEKFHLNYYYENIHTFKSLEDLIFKCIKDGDDVSDFASEDLFRIRKSLRSKTASIKNKLSDILKSYSKYLQESIFTIRGDRYCIPVKAEYKSQVSGIVHNQSASGSTYFIEPIVLVNLNNEINELLEEEKEEVLRILRNICFKIQDSLELIKISARNVYELEFVFGKANYANELEAIKPIVNESNNIRLISARHPLIDEKIVVPLTLDFCESRKCIIITGPNTGGKTVALKTLGLMHVMALSGILIPAYDGTEIMFLEEIFGDIGDEQSIEQSLSTFSSHMRNIVKITENARPKTLILLDELGSGTDPEEGAALAISIIEYFINSGCKLIGTTHYSQLKTYAINSKDVENASVEFDVETLSPTYRLNVGIPGKSNAFVISKKLGLKEDIISKANEFLSGDTIKLEEVIKSLEERNSEAIKQNREIEILREENRILNDKLKKKLSSIDKEREKILEEARLESEIMVDEAKSKIDDILKTIRNLESNGVSSEGVKDLEAARRKIREKIEKENKIKEENIKKSMIKKAVKFEIKSGSEAFLKRIGQNVTVLTNPDSKGNVTVQAGVLKLSVNVTELEETISSKSFGSPKMKKNVNLRTSSMSTSLDLRGYDTLDAMSEVDKYLDDAFVSGLNEVMIIHGKGTGALRKSITEMLRTHQHVKSHRLGEYNEGGHGVTVVYIK